MPDVIVNNIGFLLRGLAVTAMLSTWTLIGGTLLGLMVAIARYRRVPLLDAVAALYVEIIRGTPLLVVLFVTYFALPALLGYRSTAEGAAIIGFILFIGAYLAEDIRAGLLAVRPQVIEAALATGLTRAQVLRLIIVPQALRNITPVLFNQYVRLFKFTSVASVIGVNELTGSALLVNAREFQPVAIMAFLALTYLVCCYAISLVGRVLYARLQC
jgi:His/Glu/Gln/Arg/opine family amino acid ABC transporter permease subunit